jgi:hypothetical protein
LDIVAQHVRNTEMFRLVQVYSAAMVSTLGSPSSSVLSSSIGKKAFTPIYSRSRSSNGDIGESISLHGR